jgi:hypothetical protein
MNNVIHELTLQGLLHASARLRFCGHGKPSFVEAFGPVQVCRPTPVVDSR